MMRLLYFITFGVLYTLSLLPLRLLYVLSDGLYLLAYYVVRYRRPLVSRHLAECFPEKGEAERRAIEKGFYAWFADYFIESVKLFSMSRRQMRRRIVFHGVEHLNAALDSGQSCGVYLGHFCNWEWITSLPLWVSPQALCTQIYHPLENVEFDKLFLGLRSRFGAVCIPMAETLRRIAAYRAQRQPIVLGYISDQLPYWNNIHHWLPFLHHDTPVLTGSEKIMRATHQAVFYADVRRVRRGYYECTFVPMTTHPEDTHEWQLTDRYFELLEASIRRQPECYLWTHNRWKRTHEEYNLRLDPETGRVNITDSIEEIKRRKGLL